MSQIFNCHDVTLTEGEGGGGRGRQGEWQGRGFETYCHVDVKRVILSVDISLKKILCL